MTDLVTKDFVALAKLELMGAVIAARMRNLSYAVSEATRKSAEWFRTMKRARNPWIRGLEFSTAETYARGRLNVESMRASSNATHKKLSFRTVQGLQMLSTIVLVERRHCHRYPRNLVRNVKIQFQTARKLA